MEGILAHLQAEKKKKRKMEAGEIQVGEYNILRV